MTDIPVRVQHHLPEQYVVLITGANSGIGYAQAVAFLKAGHQVFAFDLQVDQLVALQVEYPTQLAYVVADVSDALAVQVAVAQCVEKFGSLHVVCNTAGILDDFAPLSETSLELWDKIWQVNVNGMFYVAKATLPFLLQHQASRMINMASIASLTTGGGGISYTTAKHAVAGFTKQLAQEYAATGLRVNAIAPGAIQTNMTAMDFQEGGLASWVADQVPTKRWAQPDEVAQLTLYLVSDAADYMNGNIIPLDGGWLIR